MSTDQNSKLDTLIKNRSEKRCGSAFEGKPTTSSILWSVLVVIAFVIQVISNVLSSLGVFNDATNGQLSNENPTYLTPDGMTFSVWGIIYLFQGLFTVYQVIPQIQNSYTPLENTRFWVVVLFLLNALWLPAFSYRLWWLSFLLIASMYVSLIMIYCELQINYGVKHKGLSVTKMIIESFSSVEEARKNVAVSTTYWFHKVFIFVGFSTNLAWLTVATILNFLVASKNSGWYTTCSSNTTQIASAPVMIGGNPDFVIMVCVAVAVLASFLAFRYGDIPFALVAMWALGGINRMQTGASFPCGQSSKLAHWAVAMIAVVGFVVSASLVKIFWQTRKHCCYGKCFQKQVDDESVCKIDNAIVENVNV